MKIIVFFDKNMLYLGNRCDKTDANADMAARNSFEKVIDLPLAITFY